MSQLKLSQSSVNISVFGRCVEYQYSVTYINDLPEKVPVEAIFNLPQSDNLTFTHVSATFSSDNTELVATIMSKSDAQNKYDDDTAEGKTVARTAQSLDGKTVTVTFGNVQPDDSISLKVRALTEMDSSNAVYVPMGDFSKGNVKVSASIIVIATDPIEALVIDSDIVTNPVTAPGTGEGGDNPSSYQMNHTWTLPEDHGNNPIIIEVCNTTVGKDDDKGGFHVTNFTDGNDHTLTCIRYQAPKLPISTTPSMSKRTSITTPPSTTTITSPTLTRKSSQVSSNTTSIVPPSATEYIFIADCSGSMGGTKIENLKKAMQLFLRSLDSNPNTYFNVIKFGNTYESMSKVPLLYSKDTLQQASTFVSSMYANMGGTGMGGPLEKAFGKSGHADIKHKKRVFLLTDGQADDERDVRRFLSKDWGTADFRLYTVGIGKDVNVEFLGQIAALKGGRCDLCDKSERSMRVILQQLRIASKPCAYDISFGGVLISSAVPSGDTVSKITQGPKTSDREVKFRSVDGAKQSSSSLPLIPTYVQTMAIPREFEGCLRRLLAHQQITQLLRDDKNKAEATKLSIEAGVLCPTTSFVVSSKTGTLSMAPMITLGAEEESKRSAPSGPSVCSASFFLKAACVDRNRTGLTRQSSARGAVPASACMPYKVNAPRSSIIMDDGAMDEVEDEVMQIESTEETFYPTQDQKRPSSPEAVKREKRKESVTLRPTSSQLQQQQQQIQSEMSPPPPPPSVPQGPPSLPPVHNILMLQSFDGSWDLSDKHLHAALLIPHNISSDDVIRILSLASTTAPLLVAGTVLAVWSLKKKYPTESTAWRMLVEKAIQWLRQEHNISPMKLIQMDAVISKEILK